MKMSQRPKFFFSYINWKKYLNFSLSQINSFPLIKFKDFSYLSCAIV